MCWTCYLKLWDIHATNHLPPRIAPTPAPFSMLIPASIPIGGGGFILKYADVQSETISDSSSRLTLRGLECREPKVSKHYLYAAMKTMRGMFYNPPFSKD